MVNCQKKKELNACRICYKYHGIPEPEVVNVRGFGKLYPSGLTNASMDIYKDAFLPGRNMLFLLLGATYTCKVSANSISIGLLREELCLFQDQTKEFLCKAEDIISFMTGQQFQILAPLMDFTKKDVIDLAEKKGIIGAYSCHLGGDLPCGECISCKEYIF